MVDKSRFCRALCTVLAFMAAGAVAETDYAWRFDTSGRAALVAQPTATSGANTVALQAPSWVEGTCNGIVTPGLCIIIR